MLCEIIILYAFLLVLIRCFWTCTKRIDFLKHLWYYNVILWLWTHYWLAKIMQFHISSCGSSFNNLVNSCSANSTHISPFYTNTTQESYSVDCDYINQKFVQGHHSNRNILSNFTFKLIFRILKPLH